MKNIVTNKEITEEDLMKDKLKFVIEKMKKENNIVGATLSETETENGVEITIKNVLRTLKFGPFSREEADLIKNSIFKPELKDIIDTLYKESKGLKLGFHSETRDDGRCELHAAVNSGEEFSLFVLTKEEADFVTKKLTERRCQEEKKPSKEETEASHSTTWHLKRENTKPSKEENVKEDLVNHPKHYTSHPSGIETIEITRWMNFNLGNSVKYILRSGKKSEDTAVQDLEKAIWYLKDEIKRLKGEYDK